MKTTLGFRVSNGTSLFGISKRAEDPKPELSAFEYLQESTFDPIEYKVESIERRSMSSIYKFLPEKELDYLGAFYPTQ